MLGNHRPHDIPMKPCSLRGLQQGNPKVRLLLSVFLCGGQKKGSGQIPLTIWFYYPPDFGWVLIGGTSIKAIGPWILLQL